MKEQRDIMLYQGDARKPAPTFEPIRRRGGRVRLAERGVRVVADRYPIASGALMILALGACSVIATGCSDMSTVPAPAAPLFSMHGGCPEEFTDHCCDAPPPYDECECELIELTPGLEDMLWGGFGAPSGFHEWDKGIYGSFGPHCIAGVSGAIEAISEGSAFYFTKGGVCEALGDTGFHGPPEVNGELVGRGSIVIKKDLPLDTLVAAFAHEGHSFGYCATMYTNGLDFAECHDDQIFYPAMEAACYEFAQW